MNTAARILLALASLGAACSRAPDRGTPVRICWQCNDAFTAYLNGRPITPVRLGDGEPHLQVWQHEARVAPGDVLGFAVGNTKGARHFTAAVYSEGRLLFGSDTSRWFAAAAEPAAGWWTSPPGPAEPRAQAESAPVVEQNVARFRAALALAPGQAVPIWGASDRAALKRVLTASDLARP